MNWIYVVLAVALLLLFVGGTREGLSSNDYYNLGWLAHVEWKITKWGKKNGRWRAHIVPKAGPQMSSCVGWQGFPGRWVQTTVRTSKAKPSADKIRALAETKLKLPAKAVYLGKGQGFTCPQAKALTEGGGLAMNQAMNANTGNTVYYKGDLAASIKLSNREGRYLVLHDNGGTDEDCTETRKPKSVKLGGGDQSWNVENLGDGKYRLRHAEMVTRQASRLYSEADKYCDRNVLQPAWGLSGSPCSGAAQVSDKDPAGNDYWRLVDRGGWYYVLEAACQGAYLKIHSSQGAQLVSDVKDATEWWIHQ